MLLCLAGNRVLNHLLGWWLPAYDFQCNCLTWNDFSLASAQFSLSLHTQNTVAGAIALQTCLGLCSGSKVAANKTYISAVMKFQYFLWKLNLCTPQFVCCLHLYWMLPTPHRSESFQEVSEKFWWVQWDQFHQPLWWPGQAGSETPKSLPWPRARTFGDGRRRGAEGGGTGKDRHWGHSQWQITTRLHQGRGSSKSKMKSSVDFRLCRGGPCPGRQGGHDALNTWTVPHTVQ